VFTKIKQKALVLLIRLIIEQKYLYINPHTNYKTLLSPPPPPNTSKKNE
jgi:hypothetical protein